MPKIGHHLPKRPRRFSMTGTDELRELDERLEERADVLCDVARRIPHAERAERQKLRDQALDFLRQDVADHVRADEEVLFPKIAERLHDRLATAPMSYEHRAIRWWTD